MKPTKKSLYTAKQEAFEKIIAQFATEKLYKFPPKLRESISYSLVKSGGKRLRPLMFLECYNMFSGVQHSFISDIACAIECIHIFSLIHDDLPCLDNDNLRRGIPTNHIKFGENVALLAGDALLNLAYETLFDAIRESTIDDKAVDTYVAEGCYNIAQYAGGNGMIGGQIVDVLLAKSKIAPSDPRREVEYIYRNKTCALFVTSIRAGAIIAGIKDKDLENICAFAEEFGFAFQLLDDLDDIKNSTKIDPAVSPYLAYLGKEKGIADMKNYALSAKNRLKELNKRFDTAFFEELLEMFGV